MARINCDVNCNESIFKNLEIGEIYGYTEDDELEIWIKTEPIRDAEGFVYNATLLSTDNSGVKGRFDDNDIIRRTSKVNMEIGF